MRGITPLIDPDVDVDGIVNALSAQTAAAPLDATGLSVFDLIVANGGADFVVGEDAAGGAAAAPVVDDGAADDAAADDAAVVDENGKFQPKLLSIRSTVLTRVSSRMRRRRRRRRSRR